MRSSRLVHRAQIRVYKVSKTFRMFQDAFTRHANRRRCHKFIMKGWLTGIEYQAVWANVHRRFVPLSRSVAIAWGGAPHRPDGANDRLPLSLSF